MADIVDVYHAEKETTIKRRQLPLHVYENLTVVMDLNPVGLVCDNDNPQVKRREFDEFMTKYKSLNIDELMDAVTVDANDVFNVLNQTIPCVGCRRSVERLFYQLCKSGHPTLDPLVFRPDNTISIKEYKLNPFSLASLLNGHSSGIDCVVPGQSRWKKSQRCMLHSLEAGCGLGLFRGTWGSRPPWRVAWESMRAPARAHITLIQYSTLHDTLHVYLKKHKFCIDCKTKVLRACLLLVDEKPEKEKGFVPALYNGIKCCYNDKHLHLQPKTDFITQLICRAEPDLLGSHRERHAKTMEIAQEEVLICLGICMYERLQRVSNRVREEENMCQMLTAVAVEALYRNFETTLEQRRGVSKLELLYDEITQEEITKQQRKEQKKLKKRKKKERQATENKCKDIDFPLQVIDSEEPEDKCSCEECIEERDTPTALMPTKDCRTCSGHCNCCDDIKARRKTKIGSLSPNDHSQDCGYSSGNNGGCCETMSGCSSLMSSPEGSEVACSEGFCNHEGGDCLDTSKPKNTNGITLSLQEMLMDTGSTDDEGNDASYIPLEDILEFKSRRNVSQKREELRRNLRQKFAQLCVNISPADKTKPQTA